jgi:hypothetical protein
MGGHDVETVHEPDALEGRSARISAAVEEWDWKVRCRTAIWSHTDEWLTGRSPDPIPAPMSLHRGGEARSIEAWVPRRDSVTFAPATDSDETTVPPEVEALFHRLANDWREATLFTSAVDRIVMNHAYQRIIGLGPIAIPLILRELRREPELWFWALSSLTGEDAAAGEDTVEGAATRWVEWGVSRGYIE